MTPFSRTFPRYSASNTGVSPRDLDIEVRGRSRSLKMVPFESMGKVSYSHSIITMAVSCMFFRYSEISVDFFHTPCSGSFRIVSDTLVLYHFLDKLRNWSKVATFSHHA